MRFLLNKINFNANFYQLPSYSLQSGVNLVKCEYVQDLG